MRIILAVFGFMLLLCAAQAWSGKSGMRFDKSAIAGQGEGADMLLVQNDGDTNRRGCGRRDKPPLLS